MKLIALGDNVIDYYHNTEEYFPGGNAVNVAVHAARLGARAAYLGALGGDGMARRIEAALEENGVDYRDCPVFPDRTTKVCSYDVVDGERRFREVITGSSWVGPLQLGPREMQVLEQADLIVSSCNAKMPEQMAAVQALPAVFAFDFGEKEKYRTEAYRQLVCHRIDLAMLSCEPMAPEAFAALCAPLHARGVVHVLATMGTAGQMLSAGGEILKGTTQMVKASDTMGAGDSFLAAFLCALYPMGWQKGRIMPAPALQKALEAGRQASARNCLQQGGFGCKTEVSFPPMI